MPCHGSVSNSLTSVHSNVSVCHLDKKGVKEVFLRIYAIANNQKDDVTLEELHVTDEQFDTIWRVVDSDLSGYVNLNLIIYVEIEEMTNIIMAYEIWQYEKETKAMMDELLVSYDDTEQEGK